jgi:hypothetical protein
MTRRFVVVSGLPGSGKTTTIARWPGGERSAERATACCDARSVRGSIRRASAASGTSRSRDIVETPVESLRMLNRLAPLDLRPRIDR